MASVRQRKDGRRFICFTDYDGKRRDVQIKGLTPEQLAEVAVLLEKLVYCRKWGVSPDSATMERLTQVSAVVAQKLLDLGLVDPALVPAVAAPSFGEHCADYLANRAHLKERTQKNEATAVKKLLTFFSPKVRVDRITAAQAQDYRGWLLRPAKDGGGGCRPATVAGYIKTAKRVFERAVDMGVLRENPFAKVKVGSTSNPERKKELPEETFRRALDALREIDRELCFALSLGCYGGLRLPHEALALKFSDMETTSAQYGGERLGFNVCDETKTGARWTPFFPELWQEWEWFKSTQTKKSEYLFPRYRRLCESAIHTNLRRRLKEMGIKPWPVLLHSLRTRFINWLERKGVNEKAKTDWVGNDENTRDVYYLRGSVEDLERVFADCANFNGAVAGNLAAKSPLLAENRVDFSGAKLAASSSSALVPAASRVSLFDVLKMQGQAALLEARILRRQLDCRKIFKSKHLPTTQEEYWHFRRWYASTKKRVELLEKLAALLNFGDRPILEIAQEIGAQYPLPTAKGGPPPSSPFRSPRAARSATKKFSAWSKKPACALKIFSRKKF